MRETQRQRKYKEINEANEVLSDPQKGLSTISSGMWETYRREATLVVLAVQVSAERILETSSGISLGVRSVGPAGVLLIKRPAQQ